MNRRDYVKFDDNREVTDEEWANYEEQLKDWDKGEYESEMHKAMAKPNPPNYFWANND